MYFFIANSLIRKIHASFTCFGDGLDSVIPNHTEDFQFLKRILQTSLLRSSLDEYIYSSVTKANSADSLIRLAFIASLSCASSVIHNSVIPNHTENNLGTARLRFLLKRSTQTTGHSARRP